MRTSRPFAEAHLRDVGCAIASHATKYILTPEFLLTFEAALACRVRYVEKIAH